MLGCFVGPSGRRGYAIDLVCRRRICGLSAIISSINVHCSSVKVEGLEPEKKSRTVQAASPTQLVEARGDLANTLEAEHRVVASG